MKTRICLVLLSLMGILAVSGCQRPTEESSQQYRTVRFIHPVTGRVDTMRIPVDDNKKPDPAGPATGYTTQRVRNPETGRIEIKQVPVSADTAEPKPCQPKADAANEESETAEKQTAGKEEPEKQSYTIRWDEHCSVERAFDGCEQAVKDLGLTTSNRYTTQRVQNPQTGQIETKRVPVDGGTARQDGLSGMLETQTTAGIRFQISILLSPPESAMIAITATSANQPNEVLEQQATYLKQKIGEAIQQEPPQTADEIQLPYPESMVFDCPIDQVYNALYQWADKQGFDRNSSGGRDRYYRTVTCETASDIRFSFTLRLIDANKTKMQIVIKNFDGKDEFPMILKTLEEAVKGLNEDNAAAADSVEKSG